jgi:hypothetical protein
MIDGFDRVIAFGEGGNSNEFPLYGWCQPEPRHAWTEGTESGLMVPRPGVPGSFLVTLEIRPFLFGDRVTAQRLTVLANGGEVGDFTLKEPSTIECIIPPSQIRKRPEWVSLTFRHPDAVRPADIADTPDRRQIALAFEVMRLRYQAEPIETAAHSPSSTDAATEAGAVDGLLQVFENLGENHEFGLVQRHCGIEKPGLLRFASAPLPVLIGALQARFEGIGDPDRIEVLMNNREEYLVLDRCFGFIYHPGLRIDDVEPDTLRREQAAQLTFLRKQLIKDLADPRKIFVYRGMRRLPPLLAKRLLTACRAFGSSTLLWVDAADEEHGPGTVERLGDGLVKGYLDRFAAGAAADKPSLECWLTLCRKAHELHLG